jgi:CHAT domain-containing protein
LYAIRRDTDQARKPAKQLIAFADPILAQNSSGKVPADETLRNWSSSLSELPYARVEVQKISELFPKEQFSILIGKDATETNAKTMQLREFRTLHFASHGLIDEEHPQLSSIVLNPGSPEEDGYLTMREVFDLKLNADLVVLSACKTGLGRNTRGEGLTGLARAFFCAGASSVLVSLWNVNDRSTSEFMTAFYTARTGTSMSKTAALREARLKMIQSKKYSHPYYWSPFILIGAR